MKSLRWINRYIDREIHRYEQNEIDREIDLVKMIDK